MTEEQGEQIVELLTRIADAIEVQTWTRDGNTRAYLWSEIPVRIVVHAVKGIPDESEPPS